MERDTDGVREWTFTPDPTRRFDAGAADMPSEHLTCARQSGEEKLIHMQALNALNELRLNFNK